MLSESLKQLIHTVPMPMIENHAAFVANLKFLHGIMLASGPLLEAAIQKSDGALRDYFRAHLAEEQHHAEWLREDMAKLGEVPSRFDHAAAATAGAQYYYLQHVGPHALLGYMAALEFRPIPMAQIEALEKLYTAAPIRTLRHHAAHDPDHAKELARMIDLHEAHADIICYSSFVTAKMLQFYLNERMRESHAPIH